MPSAPLEQVLLDLVARRSPGSVCPSEVARALPGDWRARMPQVRALAVMLARGGHLQITQRGAVLDATRPWRGAIRLRMPDAPRQP